MTLTRRGLLGGGLAAALTAHRSAARADDVVDIAMQGNDDGSLVWFEPAGILVAPGRTVRWTNRNAGNAHTATAYHPGNFDRPLRIPGKAKPWNSDYLLPDESFSTVLVETGVYDYYCIPHEHAGMVGRIVVARPGEAGPTARAYPDGDLPEVALKAFPSVEEIVGRGVVRRVRASWSGACRA